MVINGMATDNNSNIDSVCKNLNQNSKIKAINQTAINNIKKKENRNNNVQVDKS